MLLAWGVGGLVREAPLGVLWQPLLPAPLLCQAGMQLLPAEGGPWCPRWGRHRGSGWELKYLADGSFSPVPTEWCCAQRGHQEGPEPQTGQLGQPDRVCTDERGLCRGPGQCLAFPIPLLPQRGRYPVGTGHGPPPWIEPTLQGLGHPFPGTDTTPDKLASGPDLLCPHPGLGALYLRHRPPLTLVVCCFGPDLPACSLTVRRGREKHCSLLRFPVFYSLSSIFNSPLNSSGTFEDPMTYVSEIALLSHQIPPKLIGLSSAQSTLPGSLCQDQRQAMCLRPSA